MQVKSRTQDQFSRSHPERDTVLISCAGLGMGNASRAVAVMEALQAKAAAEGREIYFHAASWGAGYRFLASYRAQMQVPFDLSELRPLSGQTMWSAVRNYFANISSLRRLRESVKPRLVVMDSDYHFPAFFGVRRIFVGQAHDVVARARRRAYRLSTWREWFNFHFKERLDAALQSLTAHMVLVPCFSVTKPRASSDQGKIKNIPLIVRKEFLQRPQESLAHPLSVGLLLSGSQLEKKPFITFAETHGFKVLSPVRPEAVPTHAAFLDSFDIVFTQGGLSSISEGIARGKFLVVFPIKEHPEQILNACEVEDLGLGLRASTDELEDFPALLERISWMRAHAKAGASCSGAEAAAAYIYRALKRPGAVAGAKPRLSRPRPAAVDL